MRYINGDFFLITFGLVFSLPNIDLIFLQYLSPIILRTTNPTIPFIVFVTWVLVSFGAIFGVIDFVKKYHKMRGILTNNHARNIIFGAFLGVLAGMLLNALFF